MRISRSSPMRMEPPSTRLRVGRIELGWLNWLLHSKSMRLSAEVEQRERGDQATEQGRVAQHGHDQVRQESQRDPDDQAGCHGEGSGPAEVVAQRVANERADGPEGGCREVEDA